MAGTETFPEPDLLILGYIRLQYPKKSFSGAGSE
jgi:hypothetical protein